MCACMHVYNKKFGGSILDVPFGGLGVGSNPTFTTWLLFGHWHAGALVAKGCSFFFYLKN